MQRFDRRIIRFLLTLTQLSALVLLASCATAPTPGEEASAAEGINATGSNNDPLEPYNRWMFNVNDAVDTTFAKPLAQTYRDAVPDFARDRVSRFFSNLDDVVVLVNDLLQLKFEQAAMDASRLVYNTTFGLGGLFDVATDWGLPKHNEDFGQTLGYWGVGEGVFIVLPLLGPSTLRDTVGRVGDSFVDPITYADPASLRLGLNGGQLLDLRARLIPLENAFADAAVLDPYSFQREAYRQNRRNLIFDGEPPADEYDDALEDELFEDL